MSTVWNHLQPAIRNHLSTVTFVMIAALTLITMMSLTCNAHSAGAPSATVGVPAANPVLMHNVSGTDNPLLLLLAAMSS